LVSKVAGAGLILFGAFLVYLAIFGLTVPGLFTLTGDIMTENFDSLATPPWTTNVFYGKSKISPSGYLEMSAGLGDQNRAWIERTDITLSSTANQQFTAELRITMDSWKATADNGDPDAFFAIQFYSANFFSAVMIGPLDLTTSPAKVRTVQSTASGPMGEKWVSLNNPASTHVWLVTVDQLNPASTPLKLYLDGNGNPVNTWSALTPLTVGHDAICYGLFAGTSVPAVSHTDYFFIDKGLKPPSGGQQPTTGHLKVTTKYSSDSGATWSNIGNVQVELYKNGAHYAYWTTASSGSYLGVAEGDVEPGTYTFSATYNGLSGVVNPTSIQVSAGDTGDTVTVGFSTGQYQPPSSQTDYLAMLKTLLADPAVRTLLVLSGVGMVGLGFIILLAPSNRRPSFSLPEIWPY
jgi:hypothetical protein